MELKELSVEDYSRSMSFLYIAKWSNLCIDYCSLMPNSHNRPKMDEEEKDCVTHCIHQVKKSYKQMYPSEANQPNQALPGSSNRK